MAERVIRAQAREMSAARDERRASDPRQGCSRFPPCLVEGPPGARHAQVRDRRAERPAIPAGQPGHDAPDSDFVLAVAMVALGPLAWPAVLVGGRRGVLLGVHPCRRQHSAAGSRKRAVSEEQLADTRSARRGLRGRLHARYNSNWPLVQLAVRRLAGLPPPLRGRCTNPTPDHTQGRGFRRPARQVAAAKELNVGLATNY